MTATGEHIRKDDPAGTTFEDYVSHIGMPFAWLVVATPIPAADLDRDLDRLTAQLVFLRKRESSESARIELERGQKRYRELTYSRGAGAWNVHVLVGGLTRASARRSASLLCGSGGLHELSLALTPATTSHELTAVWAEQSPDPDGAGSPFVANGRVVAGLTRGPARELPGIHLIAPLRFDLTPQEAADNGPALHLGEVIDESQLNVGEFSVPYDTLNRHTFICGATGSGKSQTARQLLEGLSTAEHPVRWLAVEPAKAEYRRMAARLGPEARVLAIRPGDLDSPPASLNPLEPEPGFSLQSHADLVRALFLAAFEANEPFPQVLSQALTRCYVRAGWDLVTSSQRPAVKPRFRDDDRPEPVRARYPTLGELQAAAREVVDSIGYGREIAADVRGFVDVRMGSLRTGTPGRFFEGGHPLDIGGLLERNVVLEIESITSDQDKAFLMGTVLIRIVEHLRVRSQSEPVIGLRHVLLIEEAHRLLKRVQDGPAAAAVELFASLLSEIRAYGEGVVVVEQIPAKIVPDVLKNTALKIMHRLPALDDREAVGATMNLGKEQSEAVVSFAPGIAAATVDGADRPLLIRIPSGTARESGGECETQPPFTGRRSQLCGESCLTRACVLTEINEASALAFQPAVVIWVESVTASLIIGLRPPELRDVVRTQWQVPQRELDCALATVTDRAVDARRPLLRRWLDPDDFARQLHTTLIDQLNGRNGDPPEPRRWNAGYFRFLREWITLSEAIETNGAGAEAHPATPDWIRRGLVLEGATLGEQLAELEQHPSVAEGGKRVAVGDMDRSGLREALIELTGSAQGSQAHRAFNHACRGEHLEALTTTLAEVIREA